MGYAGREELLTALNELLEAERAGAPARTCRIPLPQRKGYPLMSQLSPLVFQRALLL